VDESTVADERLELIFTCCHLALALEDEVALTLRTLGGLSTEEIARAFLVPEQTMAKRPSAENRPQSLPSRSTQVRNQDPTRRPSFTA
jgi:predicted RNA polymerase sigma factor